jgi:hypothetical protein
MAMDESLFKDALAGAFNLAMRHGLANGNANMIAADAAEMAWVDCKEAGAYDDIVQRAVGYARTLSLLELRTHRSWVEMTDVFDAEQIGRRAIIIGIPAEQQDKAEARCKLGDLQAMAATLSAPEMRVLTLMLGGLGVMEIAKETGRAVPLIVADVARLRESLTREAA